MQNKHLSIYLSSSSTSSSDKRFTVGGSRCDVATPQPGSSNEIPRKRFAKTTLEEVSAVKEMRFEEKTVKSTRWGTKIFSDWLTENGFDKDFQNLSPSELDILLAQFYVEVKTVSVEFHQFLTPKL